MKVSLNWVRKFTDVTLPPERLVEKIGAQLGEVETVTYLAERYKGAVIAKVLSCQKHSNADKLSVCLVDAGKSKPVQVVCGAPNVAAGQTVVWLPPGSVVPNTFDKDPFVLEAREIRGELSNGMIASAKELAIGDDHTGIVVLENDIKPGTSFIEAFELDDVIIDIENKMFTHRPDLFGMLGVAREIAGIQARPFKSPSWYVEDAGVNVDGRKTVLKLQVKNELPDLVPRFCAVAIKDIRVGESPLWLRTYLARVGVRPINNIVDLTNYLMLETAQPLHAYDYDKVQSGVLGVRMSKPGEKLTLLGGKTIELKKDAIVITDGRRPIGLGGVMGGADTEVDENTKNIILEVANFDMNTTRRAAMEYGLFTDAAARFTKGQSPRQNMAVLCKAIEKVRSLAGGRVASAVVDDRESKVKSQKSKAVMIDIDFINRRLGLNLTASEIKKLLENVEFKVEGNTELKITPPFWRMDIEIPEDIVEEVGRLYGYDHLPMELPTRTIKPARVDELLSIKSRARNILSAAGASEVLTYSFVHGSLLSKVGQDSEYAYQLRNALSPDLQYYRLSLTPSLLEKVHPNIKLGYDDFALFEFNKVHAKTETEDGLPIEFGRLALIYAAKEKKGEARSAAAYFQAKNYVSRLFEQLNLDLRFEQLKEDSFKGHELATQMIAPFEASRSAIVYADGRLAGVVGEYRGEVARALKLSKHCAGAELFISALQRAKPPTYEPLNRFPSLEQDLCLRAAATLAYEKLNDFLTGELGKAAREHGYKFHIDPIDIFQKEPGESHKQTTWHIRLWHPERTLTSEEANKLFDKIADEAKRKLKAERV